MEKGGCVTSVYKRVLLLAALGAVAAAAVGASLAAAKSGSARALPSGTYKIGYVESITGRLAFYEPPWGEGVKTAIDQVNAKGGVDGKLKLELITQDGKSDPATGAVAARDLVSQGVQFGVTACDQDIGVPAALVFQKAKIPVVMSCGSGWTFPQVVGDYSFINVFGTAAMGAAQAEFAIKQGWKQACDLSSNDYFYGKNTSDNFEARYKQLGGKIVCHVFYKLTQTDFRSVATQIANAKPQVVVTTLVLPGATVMLKQLRAQGYKGPMLWSDAGELISGAGAAVMDRQRLLHDAGLPDDSVHGGLLQGVQEEDGQERVAEPHRHRRRLRRPGRRRPEEGGQHRSDEGSRRIRQTEGHQGCERDDQLRGLTDVPRAEEERLRARLHEAGRAEVRRRLLPEGRAEDQVAIAPEEGRREP